MIHRNAILLRPSAGLANRMRAIDSCVTFCQRHNIPLEIVWISDYALGARFSDLFEPLSLPDVMLREGTWWDRFRYGVPIWRRNLKLPLLYQAIRFGHRRIDLWDAIRATRDGTLASMLLSARRPFFLPCCTQVVPSELDYSMFHPLPFLQERIDNLASRLSPHCVGVHVRRGDHQQARRESPEEAFVMEMDRLLDHNETDGFFLATDDLAVRARMKERYGARLVTQDAPVSRISVEGICGAVVDLWVLSRCRSILGSSGSTFDITAARMSGIPCRVVSFL